MGVDLPFRTGYYVVSLLLIFYSRTCVVSTLILAVAGWLAYGHVESNSTGQEFVAFLVTWICAVATAVAITLWVDALWIFHTEAKFLTRQARSTLCVRDFVLWLEALLIAAVAYLCTEIAGYDDGTFYRLQSLGSLCVLLAVVYAFDQISANTRRLVLTAHSTWMHGAVAGSIALAIVIDILIREPSIWRFLVPAVAIWAALQVPKVLAAARISTTTRRQIYNKFE